MSTAEDAAVVGYLTPRPYSFWRWSKEFDGIEWADGPFFVFTPELANILDRVRPQAFPPLEALLLVVAAGRDSFGGDGSGPREVRAAYEELLGASPDSSSHRLPSLIRRLQIVHALPRELCSDDALPELCAIVFEGYPSAYSRGAQSRVVEALRSADLRGYLAGGAPTEHRFVDLPATLERLCRVLDGLTEEALRTRIATGLDAVPIHTPSEGGASFSEPQPDLSDGAEEPSTVCELIASLQDDEELGAVARIARNLAAAVHLPRTLGDPDEQPLGGVSDISNRGPLDRLLLSELAHDDDVLTARVALKQALYIRRETPPSTPPRRRVLLLDTSLRSWGVPRVYLTAVGLAMAAQAEADTEAWSLGDQPPGEVPSLAAVDFRTRAGLLAHLGELRPDLTPSAVLPNLADAVDAETDDAVLLIPEETAADPEFLRSLAESRLSAYLGVVSRDGRFRLVRRTPLGEKPVREATLDLDALLEAPKKARSKRGPLIGEPTELPAIFAADPFPLRLPHPVRWEATFGGRSAAAAGSDSGESGLDLVHSLTRDGRWMVWHKGDSGGLQHRDDIPPGDLLVWDNDRKTAVIRAKGNGYPVPIRFDVLSDAPPAKLFGGGGTLLTAVVLDEETVAVLRSTSVDLYRIDEGIHLRNLLVPGELHWKGGRFYRDGSSWHALVSRTPGEASFEPIFTVQERGDRDVIAILDGVACNGPIAVRRSGAVVFTHDMAEHRLEMARNTVVTAASLNPTGNVLRLSVRTPRGMTTHQSYRLPTLERVSWSNPGIPSNLAPREMNLRTKINRIGRVGPNLALESKSGQWIIVAPHPSEPSRLRLRKPSQRPDVEASIRFEDSWNPPGRLYKLRTAGWPDGSVAWTDSRGLLHLRATDRSVPECTLILDDKHVSGWAADDRRWGSSLYHGPGVQLSSPNNALRELIQPFAAGLTAS